MLRAAMILGGMATVLILAAAATAAAQGSPAEADVSLDRHCIHSLYGDVKLQFAAYLHAQASTTTRDVASAESRSSGSYQEFSFYMKACATEKMYAMTKMDVEDEDDVVEQLYFAWDDIGGSPVSISFGEKQVRFGQWAALCYNSGLAYGFPMVSGLRFPGWMTDVVQFETKIKAHETTDVYVATLLNPNAIGSTAAGDPRDTGFFQSYSLQVETKPVEGLHAKLSLLNFHDEDKTAAGESTDASAWSAGVTWHRKSWRIFAEYVGTQDWDNTQGYDLNLYEIGFVYDITDKVGLGFVYDWANANGQGAGGADAVLTNVMVSIGYTFEKDVKAYIEYVHQEEESANESVDGIQLGVHWWF